MRTDDKGLNKNWSFTIFDSQVRVFITMLVKNTNNVTIIIIIEKPEVLDRADRLLLCLIV